MSPEEELIRAGQARIILDNQIFIEARRKIEEGLVHQMKTVGIRDTEMHTKLVLSMQLWESLMKYLEREVETGRLAEYQIEDERRRKSMMDTMFGR